MSDDSKTYTYLSEDKTVSVIHRRPGKFHPDHHSIQTGKVGAHGCLVLRGPHMEVTLHHDAGGDVVGVEVLVRERLKDA